MRVRLMLLISHLFCTIFQDQRGRCDRRARTDGAPGPTNCERGGVLSSGYRRAVGECTRLEGEMILFSIVRREGFSKIS